MDYSDNNNTNYDTSEVAGVESIAGPSGNPTMRNVTSSGAQPPLTRGASIPSSPKPSQNTNEVVDNVMEDIEEDDMPPLRDITDSEYGSDEDEVEMQAAEDNSDPQSLPSLSQIPSSFSTSSSSANAATNSSTAPSRPNRRARVDDDDDEERDRRHPSQRMSNSAASEATPGHPNFYVPGLGGPPATGWQPSGFIPPPFVNGFNPAQLMEAIQAMFPPFPGPAPTATNNNTTEGTPLTGGVAEQQHNDGTSEQPNLTNGAQTQPTFSIEGFAISMSIGPDGQPRMVQRPLRRPDGQNVPMQVDPQGRINVPLPGGPAGQGPNGGVAGVQFPPLNFGNFAPFLAGLGLPLEEREDPERAKKLVEGLEDVPVGLVKRLSRVGGQGGMGEDELKGGDGGCAICWDRLLPENVDVENMDTAATIDQSPANKEESDAGNTAENERSSTESNQTAESSPSESTVPRIVSLPCAHVFHADCLIPWFSRPGHTTCPTCRFNIDPENLTYVRRMRERPARGPRPTGEGQANETTPANPAPTAEGATQPHVHPVSAADTPVAPGLGATDRPQPQGVPDIDFWFGDGANAGIMSMIFGGPLPDGAAVPPTGPAAAAPVAGDHPIPQSAPAEAPHPSGSDSNRWTRMGSFSFHMSLGGVGSQGPRFGNPTPVLPPTEAFPTGPRTPAEQPLSNENNENNNFGTSNANEGSASSTDSNETLGAQSMTLPFETPASTSQPGISQASQQAPRRPQQLSDVRVSVDIVFDSQHPPADAPSGNQNSDESQGDGHENIPDLVDRNALLRELGPGPEDTALNEPHYQTLLTLLDQSMRNAQERDVRQAGAPGASGSDGFLGAPPVGVEAASVSGFNPLPQPPLPFPIPRVPTVSASRPPGQTRILPIPLFIPRNAGPNRQPSIPNLGDGTPVPGAQRPTPGQHPRGRSRSGTIPWITMPVPFGLTFEDLMRPAGPEAPKRPWAPPPPPGVTLRQRIERNEQEAGLRCDDVSCGLGPSDEDPLTDEEAEKVKTVSQFYVSQNEADNDGSRAPLCAHKFHASCLVSAARVALMGANASFDEKGCIGVACPVCRHEGCLTKQQWDEGVTGLA